MRNRALTTLAAAATGLVLAGCTAAGGEGQGAAPGPAGPAPAAPAAPSGTEHNQADVAFVRGMIPHHGQALEMAGMARDRAQSPQVKDLAGRIEAAQGPEIATMRGWLRSWGADDQPGAVHGMAHDQAAGMAHPMSAEELHRLTAVSGAEFDRMFLEMMIQHHEGAVAMAGTEVADGRNAAAIDLARRIAESQRAEIGEMRELLTQR